MKKLFIVLGLVFTLSIAQPIYAQTTNSTDTTTLIAQLQATLVQLLEQLIAQLQAQIQAISTGQTANVPIQTPTSTSNLESAATTVIPPNPNDTISGSSQLGSLLITSQRMATTIPVGQTRAPLISLNVQPQGEDETLLKFTVDLGASTQEISAVFKNLYLVDSNGNILKVWDMSQRPYVQSGNNYVLNVPLQIIISQGTTKNLLIEADIQPAISTQYQNFSLSVDSGSIYAEDEAGITTFGPTQQIKPIFTITGETNGYGQIVPPQTVSPTTTPSAGSTMATVSVATASIALAPSTPATQSVKVTDTVNKMYLWLPVIAFNITAQNDAIHIHNLIVNFSTTGTGCVTTGTGCVTAAYLYNGSTQVASASINSTTGVATFSNITDGTAGATVSAGQTTTYTIKTDVASVNPSVAVTATINGSSATIYDSQDATVTTNGSATGNTITVTAN